MADLGQHALVASPSRVAVIGAGWAGLAAAIALTRAGIDVTVFEASRTLGGRARAVPWILPHGVTLSLDNGQHILIGAYHDTFAFMRAVGVDPETVLARQALTLCNTNGLAMRAARLPAPLHMAAALLFARGLSASEKLAMARLMIYARTSRWRIEIDRPLKGWLLERHQPERLIQKIWGPLCVAALNTRVEIASTQIFLNVLRDSLGAERAASDFLLPRAALSALLPDAAGAYLRAHARVELGARVLSIEESPLGIILEQEPKEAFAGVPDGQRSVFDAVIVAAPAHQLRHIVTGALAQKLDASVVLSNELTWQPIATVYLYYAAPLAIPEAMIALSDDPARQRFGQWVFDKERLGGIAGLVAVVISAEGPHLELSHDELARFIHSQLEAELGFTAAPVASRVIVEKRATFAAIPGLRRAANRTASTRVMLAGDYTESDYPATLEGAIRSGAAAAASILEELNQAPCAS